VFDNPQTPPADVTQEVFTLLAGPTAANLGRRNYAYTMTPIGTTAQPRSWRSTTKQAVELSGGKVAIAFWTAGGDGAPRRPAD